MIRIVHSSASLAMQRYGIPNDSVDAQANTNDSVDAQADTYDDMTREELLEEYHRLQKPQDPMSTECDDFLDKLNKVVAALKRIET